MFKSLLRLLGGGADHPEGIASSIEPAALGLRKAEHHTDRSPKGYTAFTFSSSRPDGGPWRISTERVEVAGVHVYASAVRTFARDAHSGRVPFGLRLEREPSNPHDPNAIRVLGFTASRQAGIMLGYIPRELAASQSCNEPIAAEAHRYYENGNYTELMIHILERVPTKEEEAEEIAAIDAATVPVASANAYELIRLALQMKRVGRRDDAAVLLERVIEAHRGGEEWHGAVTTLTAIYRQRKEWDKELALLERLFSEPVPRGRTYEQLRERLEAARQRVRDA